MSTPGPAAMYAAYEAEVAGLLDVVLAGGLAHWGAGVERRVVESLGALSWLVGLHAVDGHGRCRVCRPRRWGQRPVCTVYRALILHVRRSGGYVPAAVMVGAAGAGARS